jgi:antitoxin component YwqK of YwqJK toxin-antitoxin module
LHYRRNGKLWRKYSYKEGKKDGKWTWYDTYGNLIRTELY